MPKYSLILPVRNGGNYLKDCIKSIQDQDYADFNVIVLDNASTDGSREYIQSLNDGRFKIISSEKPLTIEVNWGRIVHMPKNEYITIIGHDDLLDRNYLGVMDALITEYPAASLYQTHFRYIDTTGRFIRNCRPMQAIQKPGEVIGNFLTNKMDIMGTGFMTRSRDYDSVGGIQPYKNLLFADMELWIELSRKNFLVVANEHCFGYRMHPGATTATSTDLITIDAIERFVRYLARVKKEDANLGTVIQRDARQFLSQYCQGITHKVLRTPHAQRQTASVKEIIANFREYGKLLIGDYSYEPLDSWKVRLGKIIDENTMLHSLFLLFKKIHKKPVY